MLVGSEKCSKELVMNITLIFQKTSIETLKKINK